uniref:DNA-directed RNA polymerase subunit n=1 Tax=Pentatrichomonas hominis TaxID=5728 RepID=F8QSX5_9EUKA|nr:RNA polymerase II largest subunit [Pentatrichomonas hominis]
MKGIADDSSLIGSIDFGLFDPEEVKKFAACEITKPQNYENGKIVTGGLSDLRMGTQSPEYRCRTCGQDLQNCPGHFGYINLAEPFFHIGFSDKVYKILQMVCHKCGRLLVSYSDPEVQYIVTHFKGKDRFTRIFEKISGKTHKCAHPTEKNKDPSQADEVVDEEFWNRVNGGLNGEHHRVKEPCNEAVPEVAMGKDFLVIYKDGSKTDEDYIPAERVLNIFENISDQDLRIMGFDPKRSHPKWMILTVLPVPPLSVRPQVSSPGQAAPSQDDVTHKLHSLLQTNEHLKLQLANGAPDTALAEDRQLLQWHISTYFINDKPSMDRAENKSHRPLKVISQRLKGKEGHIRGHLSGKRVNFSARSVISPDPSIEIDQVGVPKELAKILTFPEVVTTLNQKWLEGIVAKGPDAEGGANFIISDTGTKTDLQFCQKINTQNLSPGYTVERHLRDNDIVIFNRQPSLHKMSMMGHRAFLMSGKTFRLNLCVTTPYNADFDGDEMNLHVPQSQTARAEVRHIMAVPYQIISPQANKPIIGLVQDALLGSRLLSMKDTFLTRNQVMNLMMWLPNEKDNILPPPCILKPVQLWSGKQIFSLFMPRINLDAYSANVDEKRGDKKTMIPDNDCKVIIRNGELLAGIIDKKTVARGEQSLIHVVINSYDIKTAKDFLSQTQLIVNNWLEHRGFSIGLIDCVVPKFVTEEVDRALEELDRDVNKEIRGAMSGQLEPAPGMTFMQTFEFNVNSKLNGFLGKSSDIVKAHIRRDNSLIEMNMAGSKGADSNISQIIASVAQQNMEGKRVRFGFRMRTLPHYQKGMYGLIERGFCKHSYVEGLEPPEFIFHAMAGRTGIIDTACKTSDTGYIQRRLCKSMESHHVAYDGTVRNSMNEVVQFIYGGDGLDATGLETQNLRLSVMGDREFSEEYEMEVDDATFGQNVMEQRIIDDVQNMQNRHDVLNSEIKRLQDFRQLLQTEIFLKGESKVVLPVNITRIIQTSQQMQGINVHSSKSDLNPIDVIRRVDEKIRSLIVVKGTDAIAVTAQENATLLLRIMLYSNLSAKQIIFKHRLDEKAFEYVLGSISERFYRSIVSPGEMVGTIAGQSIGEPSTQMTLNTFHYAGISAKDVTLGVPRLNEIMNLAKQIKTPCVTVILDYNSNNQDDDGSDMDDEEDRSVRQRQNKQELDAALAKDVRANVECAAFKKFVTKSEIFYDPEPADNTTIDEDREWIGIYINNQLDFNIDNYSPWVLRFELDVKSLLASNVSLPEIQRAIENSYSSELFVSIFEGNMANAASSFPPVIRIRPTKSLVQKNGKTDESEFFLREIEQQLYDERAISIKGIPGIRRVKIDQKAKRKVLEEDHHWVEKSDPQLITEGTALKAILGLDHIDKKLTYTNDINEIYDVLGIEAARNSLCNEMMMIMDNAGASLNRRHLDLLADTMTQYGRLYPVSRHGINRTGTGTLARASYEQTIDVFFDACSFAETDPMEDVSSNIIVGKPSHAGTGIVECFINPKLLPTRQGTIIQNDEEGKLQGVATPVQTMSPGPENMSSLYGDDGGDYTMSPFMTSPFPASPGIGGQMSPFSPGGGLASPMSPMSPMSPVGEAYSPMVTEGVASPLVGYGGGYIATALSPSVTTQSYENTASPMLTHAYSPLTQSSMSPLAAQQYSPASPLAATSDYSDSSPNGYSPARYNPLSPNVNMGGAGPYSYSPNQSPQSPGSPLMYNPKAKKDGKK